MAPAPIMLNDDVGELENVPADVVGKVIAPDKVSEVVPIDRVPVL